jgi:hypothetical protein
MLDNQIILKNLVMESNNSSCLFLTKSIAQMKIEISQENERKHVNLII